MPPINLDHRSPTGQRIAPEREIHDLLQRAAGQPSSRELAAARWEKWEADVARAQAESMQPGRPAADSSMRESRS